MMCGRCHKPMTLIRKVMRGGTDGRSQETQWRCTDCWHHVTEVKPRG